MAQKEYYVDGAKYYQIVVSRRGKNGENLRRRAKEDQYGRPITSKKIADRIEYKLRKEIEKLYQQSGQLTWGNWHKQCLEKMRHQFKEATVISYERGLTKWLPENWCEKEISRFTKNDVFELIFNDIGSRDNATKNIQKKILKKVKRIFEMAIEENLLNRNPAIGITVKTPPSKQEVFNSNEANLLLKVANDCNHRYYYHWALALFTGMRNGELYALRWPDIDFHTGFISVNKQWTSKDELHPTKGNANRVVPISKELKKILLELKSKGPFKELFFPGLTITKRYPVGDPRREGPTFNDLVLPRYKDWRYGEQAKILTAFCNDLGIKAIKFHDLRATFITNMLSSGVPLVKVMAIVGHANVSVTNEYLRLAGVDIKKEGTTDKLGYYIHDGPKGNLVNLFG